LKPSKELRGTWLVRHANPEGPHCRLSSSLYSFPNASFWMKDWLVNVKMGLGKVWAAEGGVEGLSKSSPVKVIVMKPLKPALGSFLARELDPVSAELDRVRDSHLCRSSCSTRNEREVSKIRLADPALRRCCSRRHPSWHRARIRVSSPVPGPN
jgi:hypothetical protein